MPGHMLVGKAAISCLKCVLKLILNVRAVVKSRLFKIVEGFLFVMTENTKLFMFLRSPSTPHMYRVWKQFLVASCAVPSPACSDHSSRDNQGTRGCSTCWESKWWMRVHGSTLGSIFYVLVLFCYDIGPYSVGYKVQLLGWMWRLPRGILTNYVSELESCIMTLDLNLSLDLTRHPEFSPPLQLCDSESRAQFSKKN